ncbi:MAG: hypothetical protein ACK500_11100 [Flavobacteriales bacterium]|jgi:hypothetical protein
MNQMIKYIIYFVLGIASCRLTSKTAPNVIRYDNVVNELPEQIARVRKLLKGKGLNPEDFYITPTYFSDIDTNPSRELFVSGEFTQHLEFFEDKRTGKALVLWFIVDTLSLRTFRYDGLKFDTLHASWLTQSALGYARNKVELAFTVGFIAGPNNAEFCKVGDGFITARYDKESEEYQFASIPTYLEAYPEFITKMPLTIIRARELKQKKE